MSFVHCPNCGVTPGDTERSSTLDACPHCNAPARRSLFRSPLPYRRFARSDDGRSGRDASEGARARSRPGSGDGAGSLSEQAPRS